MKMLMAATTITAGICEGITIIPKPQQIKVKPGNFTIQSPVTINSTSTLKSEAKKLEKILTANGVKVNWVKKGGAIVFAGTKNKELGKEGYGLTISPKRITIKAPNKAGAFYAIQTLRQLLPTEVVNNSAKLNGFKLSALAITDQPRFSWRAFMLDESRYFKGEKQVKKLLDQMAQLKMNVFHWHLTDDQGWRIEIKKYPKLTSIGSKRTNTQIGGWGNAARSGVPHEGFYTQKQIRDIVKYAAERQITIVPEIGMPGHASAAIASYPELGCKKEKIEVPVTFGKHYHTFDVSDPEVYKFFSAVLDEIYELFPSKIVHIGGDEVRFNHWKESSQVSVMMKEKGLKSYADVQINFTNKISQMVQAKKHSIMGWNEILGDAIHGGLNGKHEENASELSSDAIIHFWKGSSSLATRAIKKGHKVVNSWHSFTYLDYGYGSIPLRKAYEFDPVFSGLEEKYHSSILGFGCQMWGEWIPTVERMDFQVFPRLAAYAEVGWTELENKNWKSFGKSLDKQLKRWDLLGIKYAQGQVAVVTASDFFNHVKVGTWSPKTTSSDFTNLTFDVTKQVNKSGELEVALVYKKGTHAIDIAEVSLLKDGKTIATDKHVGFSGGKLTNIVYKLKVDKFSKGKYEIAVKAKGSGGTDSHGEVKVTLQ